ncbi:hypothetical protein E4U58_002382 [Claviceps cyperi]|nr:hypothetical protein E4U58_002382 [Claviceps cyperi]
MWTGLIRHELWWSNIEYRPSQVKRGRLERSDRAERGPLHRPPPIERRKAPRRRGQRLALDPAHYPVTTITLNFTLSVYTLCNLTFASSLLYDSFVASASSSEFWDNPSSKQRKISTLG